MWKRFYYLDKAKLWVFFIANLYCIGEYTVAAYRWMLVAIPIEIFDIGITTDKVKKDEPTKIISVLNWTRQAAIHWYFNFSFHMTNRKLITLLHIHYEFKVLFNLEFICEYRYTAGWQTNQVALVKHVSVCFSLIATHYAIHLPIPFIWKKKKLIRYIDSNYIKKSTEEIWNFEGKNYNVTEFWNQDSYAR